MWPFISIWLASNTPSYICWLQQQWVAKTCYPQVILAPWDCKCRNEAALCDDFKHLFSTDSTLVIWQLGSTNHITKMHGLEFHTNCFAPVNMLQFIRRFLECLRLWQVDHSFKTLALARQNKGETASSSWPLIFSSFTSLRESIGSLASPIPILSNCS